MSEWISVQDKLPTSDGIYITWCECGIFGKSTRTEFKDGEWQTPAKVLEWRSRPNATIEDE